jgi:2-polyprenyl-3-methyl-5-hydroxy-6-metoxy-1,4-benzoquinol methylase
VSASNCKVKNETAAPQSRPPKRRSVELLDGHRIAIEELTLEELVALQCELEPTFARAIAKSEKDSVDRERITSQAYATICTILDEQRQRQGNQGSFSMGMDHRYSDLVLELLNEQQIKGVDGGLFELGCSSGVLLKQANDANFRVGGLEVVPELLDTTRRNVSRINHSNLFLGDFRKQDFSSQRNSYAVAYWNDVFEHIPIDEIEDYLKTLHSLLKPGGLLVTITPNWHMRPSDVTSLFQPPRSEAVGFHLKEYTLGEVVQLLGKAGFDSVTTPSFISRSKIHRHRLFDWTRMKVLVEPTLEWLPYRWSMQVCRRFGFSCTVARKST